MDDGLKGLAEKEAGRNLGEEVLQSVRQTKHDEAKRASRIPTSDGVAALPETGRAAFQRDAILAWNEYQATGLHVTMEEADAWLASLGTESELPVPEPHE